LEPIATFPSQSCETDKAAALSGVHMLQTDAQAIEEIVVSSPLPLDLDVV
jgi:hypothetical protein